jgi:hypothetical protein
METEIVIILDESGQPYICVVEKGGTRVLHVIEAPQTDEENPAPFTETQWEPYNGADRLEEYLDFD